ncbi:AAA family ATPase [uncultured Thiothrix sp.]|uniref:AAA family ATPase n=1 Tax=uncultured Thiothrix sp. TaxID=223185 RepID=UPI0026043A30|nr:AAA family ATPase [uncultured Thiothrix sp.]
MYKVGLTLGKFAPLHQGHQFMLETALAQVDHLIVIIYACDELPLVRLAERVHWLQALYPQIEVLPAPDGPKETGYTAAIMRAQENYILQILAGRKVTHFFSSEPYGEHVSKALGAIDVRVDMPRQIVPISATRIRQDWNLAQQYLNPIVYQSLVQKIVLLGAPSAGKTTLAQALAEALQTEWMEEYGRTYWEQHQQDRRLQSEELLLIAQTHLQLEDQAALKAKRYLICDTNAFTTWHFAHYYHGFALPELTQLAEQGWQRYAQVWVCDIDFPYADTWERSGETNQREFQAFILQQLKERQIPYRMVSGSVEERVRTVLSQLPADRLLSC